MKKIMFALILLLGCFGTFSYADTKSDPWMEWRRGYELFREGDNHLRRNRLEEALNAYKRSRDTYRMVLEANTGWNQNLIKSKISACETQILKIEKRIREQDRQKKVTAAKAEAERAAAARAAAQKAAAEKNAREKAAAERAAAKKAEEARAAAAKAAAEQAAAAKLAAQKAEEARAAAQKAAAQKAAAEQAALKAAQEKALAEQAAAKASAEKAAAAKLAAEKAAEKAEEEKAAAEKAAVKAAQEKALAEQAAARAAAEKAAAELAVKKAEEEKAAAERAAAKAAEEKALAEKAAEEKIAAEKARAEKASEQAAAERAAALAKNQELEEFKQKYFKLYVEVENLRKQLRTQEQTVKNIDILLKEKRLAEEKNATLQHTIDDLKKQIERPEQELQNIRKQLIAERMKNEQLILARTSDSDTAKNLQSKIQTLTTEITDLRSKLNDANASKGTLDNTVADLRTSIANLNDSRLDLQNRIKKYEADIKDLEKVCADSRTEIKKLNTWLDDLKKEKGTSTKISEDIFAENRTLKNNISTLEEKQRQITAAYNNTVFKQQDAERKLDAALQTINTLNTQKKGLESELKRTRDLYISQVNSAKLNNAELETLRNEQKKNAATMQTYISRNAELTAMLDTKDSISSSFSKKIEALNTEIELKNKEIKTLSDIVKNADLSNSTKKLAELNKNYAKLEQEKADLHQNIKLLTNEKNELSRALNAARSELAIFRDPSRKGRVSSSGTVSVSSAVSDQRYNKLLAAYNDMKNRYDILSAEIESLSQPLADVEESGPEINSDEELAKFLLASAEDAAKASDFTSAAWYFSELKANNKDNAFYSYGYALYSALSSERSDAKKAINSMPDCREKYLLSGVIAMLEGRNSEISANFKKAESLKSVSPEAMSLYRKELPLVIGLFAKRSSLADEISLLQKLLK